MPDAAFHTACNGKIRLDRCPVYAPTGCPVKIQVICALATGTPDYLVLWKGREKSPDKTVPNVYEIWCGFNFVVV